MKLKKVWALFFCNTYLIAAPRISLEHFEKDLQTMSRGAGPVVAKQSSFVARLAAKREQKELIEAEIAALKEAIMPIMQEISELEIREQELTAAIQRQEGEIASCSLRIDQLNLAFEREQHALLAP